MRCDSPHCHDPKCVSFFEWSKEIYLMAILKMFAVRDKKVGIYLRPVFEVHTGSALRSWQEACNQAESPFHKFPEDFSFCQIGEFDDLNGTFKALEMPLELSNAMEFKHSKQTAFDLKPTK